MPEPLPDPTRHAFFFDFDGTLAPLAPTPDAVRVPPATLSTLSLLQQTAGGAVAVISGRAVQTLDAFLAPLRLCLSGLHGAQWRFGDGILHQIELDPRVTADLAQRLGAIARRHPGALFEDKSLSFALHYRKVPASGAAIEREVEAVAAAAPAFEVQRGKMVIELKPRGSSKGAALARFMLEDTFKGRIPVMAGDDLTDESAFAQAQGLGGIAVKIGEGPSCAQLRLASPDALADWLARILQPHSSQGTHA
jgi:trehalose 6-phosphate phosphatase